LSRSAFSLGIRGGPDGEVQGVRQGAGVGAVEEEVGGVNNRVVILGCVSYGLEDVGVAVPAAEGGKTPVYRDRRDGGEVIVEGIIGSAMQRSWDSSSEKKGEDLVLRRIGFGLVKGDHDKGVVHEVAVVQQRLQEAARPGSSDGDCAVVTIIRHVGGDEHPLGKSLGLEVRLEGGEVLDEGKASGIRGDGFIEDKGVVLADIVVCVCLLVGEIKSLESCIRHVLLIFSPRDTLCIQQINDSRDVGWDLVEIIRIHSKVVSTHYSTVVGF